MNADLYKYKIELHAHTSPVSQCADLPPREVVRLYAEAGVDGLVITNHFVPELFYRTKDIIKFYLDDYYEAVEEGRRLNVRVYLGAEIRFGENCNDYLVYGINELWLKYSSEYFGLGIKRYLKDFKGDRSVIIQAHPFRAGMTQEPDTDGSEVYNMHPNHKSFNELALEYAKKHNHIVTGGSDFHHRGQQGLGFTLTKTLPADSFELAKLIKSRDYLLLLNNKVICP